MIDNQFFLTEDFQISYQDSIATIELLFEDKIKELMGEECSVDPEYLNALKGLQEEFVRDFKITLDEIVYRKKSNK